MKVYAFILGILLAVGQAFAAMDSWMNHASTQKPPSNTTTGCYEVSTPAQLAYFSGGKPDKCIELTADLNMEGEGDDKYFWVPIAAGGSATAVKFNGNGHIIRNLYISAEEILNVKAYKDKKYAQNLGLIGAFSGKVENVILENIQVYAYGNNFSTSNTDNPVKGPLSIGTVVGWQSGGGQVLNCYVTGTMLTIGDGQAVGGIVGNNGGGTISNCYSAVNITASGIGYVGGIAGYAKNYNGSVTISSCVYAGETLSATGEGTIFIKEEGVERYFVSQAGAIVGNHYNGTTTFENVYYDSEKFESGVGADMGGSIKGSTTGTTELNSDLIACTLNGGEIQQDGSCSKEGAWSAGNEGLSLNDYGADGYKTVFDANGGSFAGGTTFVKYIKPGNVVNNEGVNDPTWGEDHAFVGWALSSDATEPQNLGEPAKGKVVHAVWNPVYTITFNAAPGKFTGEDDEKTVKIERGKKISIGDAFGNPTRENYYFRGWASNENPSVEDALVDDETGLDALPDASENRTFYAVWTEVPTYIVTFNANGHGPTISKYLEVRENQIIEGLTESEFGSAAGYVLDGWCQESECENEFVFHDTPIKEDVTVYAKWDKQSYSVNYVLNCDEKCSATNASSYTVDGLALNAPSAWDDGHHFMGWSEKKDGTDVKTSIPAGETGDKTLYAIWNVDAFTITYNAGAHGKGNIIPFVQIEYGESHNVLGKSYTRDGFTQDGWSISDGSKIVDYKFNQPISNISLNLYPHWKLNESTISVKVVSAEFPYDGKDHSAECSVEGEVPEGYTISSNSSPIVKRVSDGEKTASCTLVIKDETGTDVTESFTVVYSKGSISVKAAETPIGALTILTDESGKRAVINGEYSGTDEYSLDEDISVNSVVLDRSFTPYVPVTMTLPFDIAVENVENAKFYVFGGVSVDGNGKKAVEANRVKTGNLMANTPYMVIPTATSITFNGAVVLRETIEPVTQVGNWEFVGTYAYKTVAEENQGSIYGFAGSAEGEISQGQFARFAAGAHFVAMRAYLLNTEISNRRLAKSLYVRSANTEIAQIGVNWNENEDDVPEEQTTTVRRVMKAPSIQKTHRVFDLKGRFVNEKSKSKGVYFNR